MKLRGALAVLGLGGVCASLSACVVSTHEPVGVAPSIPLPPEPEKSPEQAALESGPSEIGASHVLISYRGAMRAAPYVTRTKEEAAKLAEQVRTEAAQGADFSELAREYSDDRGSAANGGSLGVFNRGQMVPEFSRAAFALEVGDVSEVVESPFGFHIILREQ